MELCFQVPGILMPALKDAAGNPLGDRMICNKGLCGFTVVILDGLSQLGNFTYIK